jgi:hypothetical protein
MPSDLLRRAGGNVVGVGNGRFLGWFLVRRSRRNACRHGHRLGWSRSRCNGSGCCQADREFQETTSFHGFHGDLRSSARFDC